jgi:phosphoglycolate phosphatase
MAVPRPDAVLFDLDGTLIDTAPDLLAALDHVRASFGLAPCDRARLRPWVSRGAAGLVEVGLPGLEAPARDRGRERLLAHYAENLWVESAPFPGVDKLLAGLRGQGVALGVVTNKIERFALPALAQAGWQGLFGCVVCGDHVARSKPDPEPVSTACRALDVSPAKTLFVGDDRRDVAAGRAAGVATVVAAWGYIPHGEDIGDWSPDGVIAEPAALLELWPPVRSQGGA